MVNANRAVAQVKNKMKLFAKKIPGVTTLWYYYVLTHRYKDIIGSPLTIGPRKVKMELTNACNFRCVMCANPTSSRKRGFMDYDFFTRIVDEGQGLGMQDVYVYSTGESLLHRRFCDMVDYAKQKGMRVIVTTNASLLTRKCTHRLLDAKLDVMKYSVEGSDKETYESIRRGGRFERLIENIAYFKKCRDELKAPTEIFINAVYLNNSFREAARFRQVFSPYVDEINFYPLANHAGNIPAEEMTRLDDHDYRRRLESLSPSPCVHLWNAMTVTWDGRAVLCNYDYEAETVVGDLTTHSLKEVWHSDRYAHYRRLHMEGRQKEMPVCGDCTDIYIQKKGVIRSLFFNERTEQDFLKTSFGSYMFNKKIKDYSRRLQKAEVINGLTIK